METLATLVHWPLRYIPGVDITLETETEVGGQVIQEEIESDIQASLSALKILTNRPGWTNKLLALWKKFDDETYQQINLYVKISPCCPH